MRSSEFIFGSRENAVQFAREKRWRPEGRASWLKPNGKCVHFLAFEAQLAGISEGVRVYVDGTLTATASRKLMKDGAVIICA